MADFPSTPKPSYPIEELPSNPEILVSVHKDGTEQRRYKGAGGGQEFRIPYGATLPITYAEMSQILSHWAEETALLNSFNWTHPERGTVYKVRYAERPSFRHVGLNSYEGEVRLKVVPA
jgi:hypothetical protein